MPFQSRHRIALLVALFLSALGCFQISREFHVRRLQPGQHSPFEYEAVGDGIKNGTLGFQKILVINAPWRTDRKDALSLAAAYSGLMLDWIDGVPGNDIPEKAFPPGNSRLLPEGNKGCWRAHMNALRSIVQQNLTTALVLEDDADWDFRIKEQLSRLSVAARQLPDILAQNRLRSSPTDGQPKEKLGDGEAARRSSIPLESISKHDGPNHEPYGQDWDMLWLGHCGTHLPPPSPHKADRIYMEHDETVPEPQYLKPMPRADPDEIGHVYPPHTRVVHRAHNSACTIALAVTQLGARKILHEFGIREFSKGYDFALSDFCEGLTRNGNETRPLCLTVQPPVFSHHFPLKMTSDITGHGAGYAAVVETRYVRWSVRMHLEKLVNGEDDLEDQWPDT